VSKIGSGLANGKPWQTGPRVYDVQHGGTYMNPPADAIADTKVEVAKPLPDSLLILNGSIFVPTNGF
jgi:hypothetical protein